MALGFKITTEGKRLLGAAIGSRSFAEEYVNNEVQERTEEIKSLAKVVVSQPQAVYAAFTHGMSSRWTYLMKKISNMLSLSKTPSLTLFQRSQDASHAPLLRELLALR